MLHCAARVALELAVVVCGLAYLEAGERQAATQPSSTALAPSPTPENVELSRPDADGWISLFNGKDLKGWYGDPKIWRVENGYISGKAAKADHNTFLIYNHPFANFELTCKCMLIKGKGFTNSGIQYRSKVLDGKKWIVGGYQADMGQGYWGTLYEERGRGGLGKKLAGAKDPKDGEWADYRIVANGNHLKHYLNGVQAMDFVDANADKAATQGIIALQYHAPGLDFEVRFKDMKIKILNNRATSSQGE
jgi:hypothetical protein